MFFPRVLFLPAFAPFDHVQPMAGRQKQHADEHKQQFITTEDYPYTKYNKTNSKNQTKASTNDYSKYGRYQFHEFTPTHLLIT